MSKFDNCKIFKSMQKDKDIKPFWVNTVSVTKTITAKDYALWKIVYTIQDLFTTV